MSAEYRYSLQAWEVLTEVFIMAIWAPESVTAVHTRQTKQTAERLTAKSRDNAFMVQMYFHGSLSDSGRFYADKMRDRCIMSSGKLRGRSRVVMMYLVFRGTDHRYHITDTVRHITSAQNVPDWTIEHQGKEIYLRCITAPYRANEQYDTLMWDLG